ncbi:MAG: universal stress protein [Acidobacteriaceae bacterium]|jgi:nucleotide-binding universal stress UspA family protein
MPIIADRVSVSIDNILFATDFSAASQKAEAYAKALALNFRSKVDVVHVFDPSAVTSYVEAVVGLPVTERRQINDQEVEQVRKEFAGAGLTAQASSPEAYRPWAALLQFAQEHPTDLIVSGTHSKWGIERIMLGSTAEELIRNAACPVLTVGPNAKEPGPGPLVFRSIVYATDFSPEAARAAAYALSFAQDSGAHLYLCYVLGPHIVSQPCEFLDAPFKAALKRLIPESSYDWCNPEVVVEHGDAGPAILNLAARVSADLIVLGARNASFWLTHIEHGLTPNLLAEASCPVMTVCQNGPA